MNFLSWSFSSLQLCFLLLPFLFLCFFFFGVEVLLKLGRRPSVRHCTRDTCEKGPGRRASLRAWDTGRGALHALRVRAECECMRALE